MAELWKRQKRKFLATESKVQDELEGGNLIGLPMSREGPGLYQQPMHTYRVWSRIAGLTQ